MLYPQGPELLVISPLTAHKSKAGYIVLTSKFIAGMQAFADRWVGPVTAMVRLVQQADSSLDHEEFIPSEHSFAVEERPKSETELHVRMTRSAIVLGGPPLRGTHKVYQVIVTEYSFRTKCAIASEDGSSLLRRSKRCVNIAFSEWKAQRRMRHMAGIQCNGIPTFRAYGDLNSRVLLFFDNRIKQADLIVEKALRARLERLTSERAALRLVFSGRLIPRKGVDAIPRVADELRRLGVNFQFDICGAGICEESLRQEIRLRRLDDFVHFRGVLRFREELLPFVRESADLFVCPHIQGDPSCTYIETLACGVPIAGYANEAWVGMCRLSDAGWTTPMKRPELLASKIAELDRDRSAIARASLAARTFAAANLFEQTMDARVDHLMSCMNATPT